MKSTTTRTGAGKAGHLSDVDELILDRLVEAVRTGEDCRHRGSGAFALNPAGLGFLKRHNLWQEAMRRISQIDIPHSGAQMRFLNTWTRVPLSGMVRHLVNDDDAFFAALRVLLPPYKGPPVDLFRGQSTKEPPGPSWTRSHHIAKKFALYGCENVNPSRPGPVPFAPQEGGVILQANVHHEVICAPCLLGHLEGEYIVDPRGVKYVAIAV